MATPIPPNRATFTIDEAAAATRGIVVRRGFARQTAPRAIGVVTDSRAVLPLSIFVALRGETHDGHAFLERACALAPCFVIVERGRTPADDRTAVGFIEVDDTLIALGDLARSHLERWRGSADAGEPRRVVGITGSAGKTTTKELTAALLGAVAPTHFTAGNLNNRVGVPSTVLAIDDSHRFSVLEMGMSLPGEIAAVASIARPDVAVVTNVGLAHAEGVGGRDGVMREKGAIYRALSDDGVAVVNADDELVGRAAEGTRARRVVGFGCNETATYRLVSREPRGENGSIVVIATPARELRLRVPLPGEAVAIDLTAALAAQEAASGVLLGKEQIASALATVQLAGRATVMRLGSGIVVLDDTYNANPSSVRAALSTLAEVAGERRRIAVLGEMKELGVHAEAEHAALGDVIADAGVALAIGCGGLASRALDGAEARGIEVIRAATTEEAARAAVSRVGPGDAVLVKGSRGVQAEKVVSALSEAWPVAAKPASSGPG